MTSSHRSSRGCWTCRLRKKKCDETHPLCNVCAGLCITCHFTEYKPTWMDNGSRQSQMLMQIKREVRENAHSRRRGRSRIVHNVSPALGKGHVLQTSSYSPKPSSAYRDGAPGEDSSINNVVQDGSEGSFMNQAIQMDLWKQALDGRSNTGADDVAPMSRIERTTVSCFSEYVLPQIFPAYQPCIHDAGQAWLSEMANDSLIIRNIAYLQTSFYSAALKTSPHLDVLRTKVQQMSRSILASAIITTQVLTTKLARERVRSGLVLLTAILLVQHFNVATSTYDPHLDSLNVAFKVCQHLLLFRGMNSFKQGAHPLQELIRLIGLSTAATAVCDFPVPVVEETNLKFVLGQLIFDDIIASTTVGTSPHLSEIHTLLLTENTTKPVFELEKIVGCTSSVLWQISKVAELAEWKRKSRRFKTLDATELVERVVLIKRSLEKILYELHEAENCKCCSMNALDQSFRSIRHRIWTRAALLYLHTVEAGFQPDHVEVQDHVVNILDLLEADSHHPYLLRAVVWPFCISGCLASEMHQRRFSELTENICDTVFSGSVRAAFETIKLAWSKKVTEHEVIEDFADVFQNHQTTPLLF